MVSPRRTPAAYGSDAPTYDTRTAAFAHYRQLAVDALAPQPGDTVIDVGCGTGLCFDELHGRVGPAGTIVGLDPALEMLDLAARRVRGSGWSNVVLVPAAAQDADLPAADRALFCATHDVLQSEAALDNVLGRLRPGSAVVATGGKWAPPWAVGLNATALALHAPFVRDFGGFDRPWGRLAGRLTDLVVRELALGIGYLAVGRTPAGCG